MNINYKSDFDFLLYLQTCVTGGVERRDLGWPDYDWEARLYTTSKANAYVVSCRGGVCTNCFNDNGRIHVVVNEHRMGIGVLNVEFRAMLPNGIYPDGSRLDVSPQPLGIELVNGRGDCGTIAEVEVLLPYIKGDKGDPGPQGLRGEQGEQGIQGPQGEPLTYADLTEADKADLAPIISEPTDKVLADIEPNIVHTALRKTPQSLTDVEKAQVKRNLDISKMELFIDLWNEACGEYGRYNAETGNFELNGLMDISYEEAIASYVMNTGIAVGITLNSTYANSNIRTNIPLKAVVSEGYFAGFANMPNIEVIAGNILIAANFLHCFYNDPKLRVVEPILSPSAATGWFYGCANLESVRIRPINVSFSLEWCPKINIESFKYIVLYTASGASPITITVHPDVYAKLTDESNTEWYKVMTDAVAKNITFTTV